MKEYIERDLLIQQAEITVGFRKRFNMNKEYIKDAEYVVEWINNIPAADVVEVRHGRWEKVIPTKSAAKWSTKVSCSQCHGQGYERYSYCPHCGAIMDKEE